jgi:hypothetical protein
VSDKQQFQIHFPPGVALKVLSVLQNKSIAPACHKDSCEHAFAHYS